MQITTNLTLGKKFPFATAQIPSEDFRWLSSLALPDCGRETMPARSSSLASGKFLSLVYKTKNLEERKKIFGHKLCLKQIL